MSQDPILDKLSNQRLPDELLESIGRLSRESPAAPAATGQFLKIEKHLVAALVAEVKALREEKEQAEAALNSLANERDAWRDSEQQAADDERAAIIKRLTEKPFETLDQVVAWIDKRGEPESGEVKT